MDRRTFMALTASSTTHIARAWYDPVLSTEGVGDVKTPTFYRYDIGHAPGRLHEPSIGNDGSLWTSPLDGNLWRYQTQTGQTEVFNLSQRTGSPWKGLHLWPVAYRDQVYLCTPKRSQLWVWDRRAGQIAQHAFPHSQPSVYGGFAIESREHLYLYDTRHQAVLKWNPDSGQGVLFRCPYLLSGTLYMSFVDSERQEIWGSTYTGNDIVRFDLTSDQWTGHFNCPYSGATPTAGGKVFQGNTLYIADHLNGRIIPLNVDSGCWAEPIAVPGYGEWFGYMSGAWLLRDKLYFCHSTWKGGTDSIDGEPHHFIGSWTVFDPARSCFSRLDLPVRMEESRSDLQSDYCITYQDEMYILAVDRKVPRRAMVVQSSQLM